MGYALFYIRKELIKSCFIFRRIFSW